MKRSLAAAAVVLAGLSCACASSPRHGRDVSIPAPRRTPAELDAALSSPDAAQREAAAWELAGAKTVTAATLQRLREVMDGDEQEPVRLAATWAFGHVALATPEGRKVAQALGRRERPPALVAQSRPVYPQAAYDQKIQGMVQVEILIDEHGRVARAEVRESIPLLDDAALACVRAWKFNPATRDGKAVAATAIAPVTFRIY